TASQRRRIIAAEADDLALALDLEPRERDGRAPAVLDGDAGEARVAAQVVEKAFDGGIGAGEEQVDAFGGHQHRAQQRCGFGPLADAAGQQLRVGDLDEVVGGDVADHSGCRIAWELRDCAGGGGRPGQPDCVRAASEPWGRATPAEVKVSRATTTSSLHPRPHRLYRAAGTGARPRYPRGCSWWSRTKRSSRRTPKPVAPSGTVGASLEAQSEPAMSRCAQGSLRSTHSPMKYAPAPAPGEPPPLRRSAIGDFNRLPYSSRSGIRHSSSPLASPAASNCAANASSRENSPA